jgi:hypothetical protein
MRPRTTAPSDGDTMSFEIVGFVHDAIMLPEVAGGLGEATGAVGESTLLQDESRTMAMVPANLFP